MFQQQFNNCDYFGTRVQAQTGLSNLQEIQQQYLMNQAKIQTQEIQVMQQTILDVQQNLFDKEEQKKASVQKVIEILNTLEDKIQNYKQQILLLNQSLEKNKYYEDKIESQNEEHKNQIEIIQSQYYLKFTQLIKENTYKMLKFKENNEYKVQKYQNDYLKIVQEQLIIKHKEEIEDIKFQQKKSLLKLSENFEIQIQGLIQQNQEKEEEFNKEISQCQNKIQNLESQIQEKSLEIQQLTNKNSNQEIQIQQLTIKLQKQEQKEKLIKSQLEQKYEEQQQLNYLHNQQQHQYQNLINQLQTQLKAQFEQEKEQMFYKLKLEKENLKDKLETIEKENTKIEQINEKQLYEIKSLKIQLSNVLQELEVSGFQIKNYEEKILYYEAIIEENQKKMKQLQMGAESFDSNYQASIQKNIY